MQTPELDTEIDDNTFAKEALQCEIGAKLKQAREEKGIDTEYVIKELKFSKTFLIALESGDWTNLPGEVYALGFLKQYSALLDLDVNTEIQRIKSKSFELKVPETYPDVPISPSRKWVYISIAIFIVLIIVVNLFGSGNEHSDDIQATSSEQTIKATSDKPIIQDNTEDNYAESTAESPEIKTKEDTLSEEPTPIKRTYSFFAATNDVWLQVSELNENNEPQLLREVLLKKGQSFSIIDTAAKLVLTAGNARALEVLEGNSVLFAAGTLGEENKVLKLFPINP